MDVPNGLDDATDEVQREYLAEAKTSAELCDAIREELGMDRRDTPQLHKGELAALIVEMTE